MEQDFLKRTMYIALGLNLLSLVMLGQSSAINNQYWLELPLINPAASGIWNDYEAASGIQFGGVSSSPNPDDIDFLTPEYFARIDLFSHKLNSGFGLSFYNTNLDRLISPSGKFIMEQRIALNYNYQFRFNENNLLSAGISFDLKTKNWSTDLILLGTGKSTSSTLGAGLLYKNKFWFAGASLLPFWRIKQYEELELFIDLFTLTAGGDIPVNKQIKISPGVNFTKGSHSMYSLNINLKVKIEEVLYVGASLQTGNYHDKSWQLFVGWQMLDKLLIHYGYGHAFNDFNFAFSPQQNIALQYSFSQ